MGTSLTFLRLLPSRPPQVPPIGKWELLLEGKTHLLMLLLLLPLSLSETGTPCNHSPQLKQGRSSSGVSSAPGSARDSGRRVSPFLGQLLCWATDVFWQPRDSSCREKLQRVLGLASDSNSGQPLFFHLLPPPHTSLGLVVPHCTRHKISQGLTQWKKVQLSQHIWICPWWSPLQSSQMPLEVSIIGVAFPTVRRENILLMLSFLSNSILETHMVPAEPACAPVFTGLIGAAEKSSHLKSSIFWIM